MAVSVTHFEVGIIKAPFMALVIGIVAQRRLAREGQRGVAWRDHRRSSSRSDRADGCLRCSLHRSGWKRCRKQPIDRHSRAIS
jgi:hypothetical protein